MSQHALARSETPARTSRPRQESESPGSTYWLLTRAPVPAVLVALAGVYLLGVGALLFTPEGSKVAVWWPSAGLGVALLLLAPRRRRWLLAVGIVLASGLANFTTGRPVAAALGFGLSNAAEAYVVAWWLTRESAGRPSLRSMEDLWRLVTGTALGALVVGVGIGTTVLLTLDGSFLGAAVPVMASHAAAILTVAPLALEVPSGKSKVHRYETTLQPILLLVAVGLVFSPGQVLSLSFLPLPLLLWAALRLGLRTVSYELIATGVLTTSLTAAGGGPFALGQHTGIASAATTASLVQAFLIVTSLIALALAVAVDQRTNAMARVSESEELFRKSFSESFVGMLLLYTSTDGLRIRELNQTAADILGGSPEMFEGELLQPLLETQTSLADVAARMVTGEVAGWREELWLATSPGRRIGLALSPLSISADEVMFSAQLIDITEMHEATTRLRTEKDFNAAILSTTAALIVVVDSDGGIVGVNPAGEKASEYDEQSLLGKPLWGTLVPEFDEVHLRELLDRTRPGLETPTFESDLLTADGRRRRIAWSSASLTDDAGRRTHA
ncbi:MAG TPA: MASE1 domain-containing protein, partial [Nocardioidaceae bacterium]